MCSTENSAFFFEVIITVPLFQGLKLYQANPGVVINVVLFESNVLERSCVVIIYRFLFHRRKLPREAHDQKALQDSVPQNTLQEEGI